MDALTLSSSVNISKPFHILALSKKQQRERHPRTQFGVSCRGRKELGGGVEDNLYKVLSLSPKSATTDDIKKAYRSMALRYHPDVCQDCSKKEESTRMFVQLNAAYQTLSNPRLRAEYDCELGLRSEKISVGDETWRYIWQNQLAELKRRSHIRMAQNQGSWGSRIRPQNINWNQTLLENCGVTEINITTFISLLMILWNINCFIFYH